MDTELARAKVDDFFARGEKNDKSFQRGEVVISADSGLGYVYRVNTGFIKVVSYSRSGSDRTHFIYGPGDLFPIGSSFKRTFPGVFFIAATKADLTAKRLEDFWEFIDKKPQAMRFIISILLSMHDRIYGLHLSKAQDRVIYGLLMLAQDFGRKKNKQVMVDFPLTQQELADIVRTSRTTAGQILNELEDDEKIILGRNRLIIYPEKLESMLQE